MHPFGRLPLFVAALASTAVLACGGNSTASSTLTVAAATTSLEVACSGESCGATSGSTYSGSGVGIWRYRNDSGSSTTTQISISGVTGGKSAILLFSNGQESSATLPSAGAIASVASSAPAPAMPLDEERSEHARDQAHAVHLERERDLANGLRLLPSRDGAVPSPRATPDVGAHRTWNDVFESLASPVLYSTVARKVCSLPTGRKAIFWVDPDATSAGNVTEADLAYFQTTFCGTSAGYDLVTDLRGDVWGGYAANWPTVLIQDSGSALQDVNIVFLNVPSSTGWGGYFTSYNNFLHGYTSVDGTSFDHSNESLAFFINAPGVKSNRGYYSSTLLHELTHMTDFYQRTVKHNAPYDTWLTEMAAMMTEDAITPSVTPDHYAKIPDNRIKPLIASGGAVSLIHWVNLGNASYAAGGSLGAFLNRRYGLAIYSSMVDCAPTLSGYACVDALIRERGGAGLDDEYARLGATLYGLLPVAGTPGGYGFPRISTSGLTLAAVDLSGYASNRPATATSLGATFAATTHTYQFDTVAAGRTTYARSGVVVPAGVTLVLVIQ
ncbi:MAG: hypothetical protein WCK73_11020 [Deltaproteobacteria bacterium]